MDCYPDRLVASLVLLTHATGVSASPSVQTAPVPLQLWTDSVLHAGQVPLGDNFGLCFFDYDRDGYADFLIPKSRQLWRNLGGTDFVDQSHLLTGIDPSNPSGPPLFPPVLLEGTRYGGSFGDYNADGYPDVVIEARPAGQVIGGGPQDTCLRLLRGTGSASVFEDATELPGVFSSQVCQISAETACWGDADGDGRSDLFVPAYVNAMGGTGNVFLQNLGPTPPSGSVGFEVSSGASSGLQNEFSEPEGAQYVDFDSDGDLDLYCGTALYLNESTAGATSFVAADCSAVGLQLCDSKDEGVRCFDFDMDGDFDLAVLYITPGLGARLFENRGDGTFEMLPTTVLEDYNGSDRTGMSAADWDNDGDLDLTTGNYFRQNMLVETGQQGFLRATTSLTSSWIEEAVPAWADWDHDGDLDCLLGRKGQSTRFLENTIHPQIPSGCTQDCDPIDPRVIRVEVLRADATNGLGIQNEFGAIVEVKVRGDSTGWRRRQVVSSSAGYVNQSEYLLSFALPMGENVEFDLSVDFPETEGGSIHRVDGRVNPVLHGIRLNDLEDRTIAVYRNGTVELESCKFESAVVPVLTTSSGGLMLPDPMVALPDPVTSPQSGHHVGLQFTTLPGFAPLAIRELVLDGELAPATPCSGSPFNVAVWDVTGAPILVESYAIPPQPENHRIHVPVAMELAPGRTYRLVAKVTRFRESPAVMPETYASVEVEGSLSFTTQQTCTGIDAAMAPLDQQGTYLAIRFADEPAPTIYDLGNEYPAAPLGPTATLGIIGAPLYEYAITLSGATAQAPVFLVYGTSVNCLPLGEGHLVPDPLYVSPQLTTGTGGGFSLVGLIPPPLRGHPLFLQFAVLDSTVSMGIALSNSVGTVVPE